MKTDLQSGVFHSQDLGISSLKECSFLWNHIYVFAGQLESCEWDRETVNTVIKLFENNILKIVSDNQLGNFLADYKYLGTQFNPAIRDLILNNTNKICKSPELPNNWEEIVDEATLLDSGDSTLMTLLDEEWMNSQTYELEEAERSGELRFPLNDPIAKEIIPRFFKELKEVRDNTLTVEYNLKWRNITLLNQVSISSSVLVKPWQYPYYQHKFTKFVDMDATRNIAGLKAIIPFMNRNQINDFSIDEIIELRKKKSWKDATKELTDICNKVKFSKDTPDFEEYIKNKIVFEYQDLLDEKRMSVGDVGRGLMKSSVYNGISLIPVIGPLTSAVGSIVDPILRYLYEIKSQKNLPIFLSEVRKYN